MKFTLLLCGLLALADPALAKSHHNLDANASDSPSLPLPAPTVSPALKNAVILIIRHAEKPASGYGLSAAGEMRAKAYANYFRNFTNTFDAQPLKFSYLFATADSKESHRPRLTILPTSQALGIAVDSRFKDKEFQALANEIRFKPHGQAILIVWHHGEIPALVRALGADPESAIPKAKWPEDVFSWVIELRYDATGRLAETKRINEKLMSDDWSRHAEK